MDPLGQLVLPERRERRAALLVRQGLGQLVQRVPPGLQVQQDPLALRGLMVRLGQPVPPARLERLAARARVDLPDLQALQVLQVLPEQ